MTFSDEMNDLELYRFLNKRKYPKRQFKSRIDHLLFDLFIYVYSPFYFIYLLITTKKSN